MFDTIRVRGPLELVATIPALLAFHPSESLVAVWVQGAGQRVLWTMRLDLDAPAEELIRRLLDLVVRSGEGRLLLAFYTDHADGPDTVPQVVDEVMSACRHADLDVLDALLVGRDRVWSLLCSDPDCCPPEGRELPATVGVLEAARVTQGARSVAQSREQLVAAYRLRPEETVADEALDQAADHCMAGDLFARADRTVELLTGLAANGMNPAEVQPARAAVMLLVQDVHVRDAAIAAITARPDVAVLAEALAEVAVRAPEDLRGRVAGMAAAVMATTGANAVATWALIDHAGSDSLAALMAEAMNTALPPDQLRAVFTEALATMASNAADKSDLAV